MRPKRATKDKESPATPNTDAGFDFGAASVGIVSILDKVDEAGSPGLQGITEAIRCILTTLQGISHTLEQQANTHSDLLKENQHQSKQIDSLFERIKICKKENEELKEGNRKLMAKVNDLEQHSKSYNIEIQGVPCHPGENVRNTVVKISNLFGVNISPADIENCHRLGKSNRVPNKPPAIIAKFYSRPLKEEVIDAKKKTKFLQARDLGYKDSNSKIYVNNHLTQINKNLYWLARTAAKDLGFKFVWERNAKILMRQDENAPIIVVRSPADIPISKSVPNPSDVNGSGNDGKME